MGELTFTFGAMESGKSMKLLTEVYTRERRKLDSVVIKPLQDERGGNLITARGPVAERVADILLDPSMDARKEVRRIMGVRGLDAAKTRVFVDEAQFSTPDHVRQLKETAEFDASGVDAYGLRTDFQLKVFPAAEALFALANRIHTITIPCQCGEYDADCNTRQVNGAFVFEGQQVAIEGMGDVTYSSLCFRCYSREEEAAKAPAPALLF